VEEVTQVRLPVRTVRLELQTLAEAAEVVQIIQWVREDREVQAS
jgi:hypothetical protein